MADHLRVVADSVEIGATLLILLRTVQLKLKGSWNMMYILYFTHCHSLSQLPPELGKLQALRVYGKTSN